MAEYRIDELARLADTTVRNVRVYQDRGLLAPPRRQGRVGIYSEAHLARLRLIGQLLRRGYTFANIGLYRPEMFDAIAPGEHAKLGPLIRQYADLGQVGGEVFCGDWTNVGTVEQLAALNAINEDKSRGHSDAKRL